MGIAVDSAETKELMEASTRDSPSSSELEI